MAAAFVQSQDLVERFSRSRQSSLAAGRHPLTPTCQKQQPLQQPARPPGARPQDAPRQQQGPYLEASGRLAPQLRSA